MRLRSRRSCAAVLALAVVAAPTAARASDRCEDADALPGQVSRARLRAATLCSEALGPDEPGATYVTDFGRRVRD
jgi:hypothetical protein